MALWPRLHKYNVASLKKKKSTKSFLLFHTQKNELKINIRMTFFAKVNQFKENIEIRKIEI
jgi:hypothetical protein